MFKKLISFLVVTLTIYSSSYTQIDHEKVSEFYQIYKSEDFRQHEQFKAQLSQVLNSLPLVTTIPNGYKQAATYHRLTGRVTFQSPVFADVEALSRFCYNSWIEHRERKAKTNQNLNALLQTLDGGLLIQPNLFAVEEIGIAPYDVTIPYVIFTINKEQPNLWQITIFYEELENDGWIVDLWSRGTKRFSDSTTYTYDLASNSFK